MKCGSAADRTPGRSRGLCPAPAWSLLHRLWSMAVAGEGTARQGRAFPRCVQSSGRAGARAWLSRAVTKHRWKEAAAALNDSIPPVLSPFM